MPDIRPLAGVRVADFSNVIAGPHCTRLLADMGADVVKVESPEGDFLRRRPPIRNGHSAYFSNFNVGKRGMALDLKNPKGLEAAKRLIAKADVVVENFRPGVMARLGLGYDAAKALNPTVIYCSVSGYGQTGPSATRPAYAPVIQASSGYDLVHVSYQDRERPDFPSLFVADLAAAVYAFGAIMTALYVRKGGGPGTCIDLSMLEGTMSFLGPDLQRAQYEGVYSKPMFAVVACRDGFVLLAPASENNFADLCEGMGHPEWRTDPRFAKHTDRYANRAAFMDLLDQWSATRGAQEVEDIMTRAGVPCSRFRGVGEALADPQLAHRGAIAETHDAGGPLKVLNPPFLMSGIRTRTAGPAPSLGEHTDAVLAEIGYGAAEIAALRAAGAAV